MLPRVHCRYEELDTPKEDKLKKMENGEYTGQKYEEVEPEKANLVSSRLEYLRGKLHAPALDIDYPVQCYESSTPGHYHVLIDVPMSWWKYRILMWWMSVCGILEKGYYKASVKRKASYLRKKGVLKLESEKNNREALIEAKQKIIDENISIINGLEMELKTSQAMVEAQGKMIDSLAAAISKMTHSEGDANQDTEPNPNVEMNQELWQHWT